jgi:hypothetical protein
MMRFYVGYPTVPNRNKSWYSALEGGTPRGNRQRLNRPGGHYNPRHIYLLKPEIHVMCVLTESVDMHCN